jgi:hypothetical protein
MQNAKCKREECKGETTNLTNLTNNKHSCNSFDSWFLRSLCCLL